MLKWIIANAIDDLKIVKYLGDKEAIPRVSPSFSERSNCTLIAVISAVYGWLVCIV